MYAITLEKTTEMHAIYFSLQIQGIASRFTFDVERSEGKKVHRVIIRNVRLKKSKGYCGNHAGPCQLTGKKHRHMKYLEGADWVAFNDMVNDLLDTMGISARVGSSHCVTRVGLSRCVRYIGGDGGEWDRFGLYENRIGQPTKAEYPNGTPGIDTWRK